MTEPVRLALGDATLIGVRAHGVTRFGAVRYALAPTGERRWRAPVRAEGRGELDATQPGPLAPQGPSRLRHVLGDMAMPQSEDCLHLSIWTPGPDARRRPVVVWVHGGGWQNGGAALQGYDGAHLARTGDVVVVGVNYRLGPLGWLQVPGGDVNVGLQDIELAFQWVVDHIAEFGGDPARITAMGQSAGAANIVALLHQGTHRVQRAILQSPPLARGWRSHAGAAQLGQAVCQAAGASDLASPLQLPVDALLRAQDAPSVQAALAALDDGLGLYGPVEDDCTLTAWSPEAMRAAAGQVDVLIGTTRDECAAFTGSLAAPGLAQQTHRQFELPAAQWAEAAHAAGRRAWRYRWDAAPSAQLGACHCIELPFVFGSHGAFASAPMLHGCSSAQRDRLSREVQAAWIAFIRADPMPWPGVPHLHVFR